MRFLVKNVPYTFLSLPFPLVPSSRGYRNKKRILQRSNLWIVVRLRFQQVAIEHVNEKRKGGTKKGRRSWKPKDVAPEGACWVKFSIRALKARGARINTRWQGNGREGAPRIQIPCSLSLSRNYRPSKVALPVLPRHFSRATGGGRTRNSTFPALFCSQKYSRSVFLSYELSPLFLRLSSRVL